MKKMMMFLAAALLYINAGAQTLEEGIKMYNYEKYQSAQQILAPLAATSPRANYYLGLSQIAQEKYDDALATFAKYPEDAANIGGTARVAFEKKNATQGTQIATMLAAKAKKKDWEPLLFAGDAITYSEGGNYQQAVDWYKKATESAPDNINLRISLGDAYLKIPGGGGEAMNNYEKVTGKDPKNSLAYSRIGKLWYDAHNYPLALENFGKAKDSDPANPLPYRDLGNAYIWTGKYELAKQNIEKYRELSDKSTEVDITYLSVLFLAKYYKDAASLAQQLINGGVKKSAVYGILGFSEYNSGDTSMANYQNAKIHTDVYMHEQDPAKITPLDYVNYAKILLKNNATDSASRYFDIALSKDTTGNKSETYRSIAESFKEIKDYPKAAIWYEKLVTAYPATQAVDYFWAGAMYYYGKDYTNAARLFEMMETKYPDQPSATYWRGRVGAAVDPEGEQCTAAPFFSKWLEKVGPTYDKKNDLKLAYQYLLLCSFKAKDKANSDKYKELLRGIDPADAFLIQIEGLEKAGTTKPAATPKKK